ncbi:glycosyltransferase family 2 protein [Aeromicrobium wangtongii]|uniref:glycosyltransferase family 2 protein n=1 Tax=Aeromicrobium wangtongii TaxID=2969247 RepID=UPI002017BA60|nr:glycosyltransferase family 2 protein [Aeromicrobium wangtongii]MCL3817331.1 glycosyltransferase [Aeromicrobium wangtongii]
MPIEILMPFYGDPDVFHEAVRSVLAQEDPHWRLLVVDDCYPDYSPEQWLADLADDRIGYVRNERNLGLNRSFQRCVDLATHDWITIMGNDDRLLPTYVGRVRAAIAAHPGAALVQPGVEVIDAAGRVTLPLADRIKAHYRPDVTTTTVLGGEDLTRSLLRGNWAYFPSICWRRELVAAHGFDPELGVVLDLALMLDLIADGGTMVLDPVPSFQYRRHEGSVSAWTAQDGSRFVEEKTVLLRAAATVEALGWKRAGRAARWHLSSRLNAMTRLPAALRSGRRVDVRSLLRHVFSNRLPA